MATAKKASEVPSPKRRANIREILANRRDCTCIIREDMTDDELLQVRSCRPGWQCSVLDHVRRKVVDYRRHYLAS